MAVWDHGVIRLARVALQHCQHRSAVTVTIRALGDHGVETGVLWPHVWIGERVGEWLSVQSAALGVKDIRTIPAPRCEIQHVDAGRRLGIIPS